VTVIDTLIVAQFHNVAELADYMTWRLGKDKKLVIA